PPVHGNTVYLQELCQRIAHEGYVVFALNYYTRTGQPDVSDRAKIARTMAGLNARQVLQEGQAVIDYLHEQPEVLKGQIGVLGFCVGGKYSFMMGTYSPDVKCVVDYYGMIVTPLTDNQPASPIDLVPELKRPLLAHYGNR